MESEYIPLLIREVENRGLGEKAKRMVVAFEVAGQHEPYYGVEYIAQEFGIENEDEQEKVSQFVDEVVRQDLEPYAEDFERIRGEYSDEIEAALEKYD